MGSINYLSFLMTDIKGRINKLDSVPGPCRDHKGPQYFFGENQNNSISCMLLSRSTEGLITIKGVCMHITGK